MAGLFDPLAIKGLTLKNRIVMPPMANQMADENGEVTDKHIRHYTARAKASVGLIMVEHAFVHLNGRGRNGQLGISSDSHITGLRRLAGAIREAGAASGIQINHLGSRASAENTGQQPLSPSGIMGYGDKEQSRPFTEDEIAELIAAYAAAAGRAAEAGFDIVEIHGAHGYLLCQFLSPLTNLREDRYGGDVNGRLTFAREIIAAVKKTIGDDYPLFYRIGGDDFVPGGLSAEDGQRASRYLVEAGIDVIDVSGGLVGTGRDQFTEQGFFVPLAEGIRKAAQAPVVGVGNIRDPKYADQVVRDERIDLVAIGRALLADPLWAEKAAEQLGVNIAPK